MLTIYVQQNKLNKIDKDSDSYTMSNDSKNTVSVNLEKYCLFMKKKDSYYCLLLDSDILENIAYLINKELGSRLRKLYVVHTKVVLK